MSIIHKIFLGSLICLLVAAQVAFIPVFVSPFPDLLIVVIAALCWADRRSEALWTAFLGGIFFDLLAVSPVGIRSLLLIIAASAISFAHSRADNLFSRFTSVFIIAFVWHLYPLSSEGLLFGGSALLALIDAAAAVALNPLLVRLFKHFLWEEDLQLSFKDRL